MLPGFWLSTGYQVLHCTTLSMLLLFPGRCLPLRPGGGLWVRRDGHAYKRCCDDWTGCDTCPKTIQVSNNYARVLTITGAVRADRGHVLHDLLPQLIL